MVWEEDSPLKIASDEVGGNNNPDDVGRKVDALSATVEGQQQQWKEFNKKSTNLYKKNER